MDQHCSHNVCRLSQSIITLQEAKLFEWLQLKQQNLPTMRVAAIKNQSNLLHIFFLLGKLILKLNQKKLSCTVRTSKENTLSNYYYWMMMGLMAQLVAHCQRTRHWSSWMVMRMQQCSKIEDGKCLRANAPKQTGTHKWEMLSSMKQWRRQQRCRRSSLTSTVKWNQSYRRTY